MKLLLLVSSLLLVAQSCYSMKKQPLILSKPWEPKVRGPIKMPPFTKSQRDNWQILEQNRQMMDELSDLEALQEQSKMQTDAFKTVQFIFEKQDESPECALLAHAIGKTQESMCENIAHDENLYRDSENPLEVDSLPDLEFQKLIDDLKRRNYTYKTMLSVNQVMIIALLQDKRTDKLLYDHALEQTTLKSMDISFIPSDFSPEKKLSTAIQRLSAIDSVQDSNNNLIARLQQCKASLESNFYDKNISPFLQMLTERIVIQEEIKKDMRDKKSTVEQYVRSLEQPVLKALHRKILKLKKHLKNSAKYTAPKRIKNKKQCFSCYQKALSSCPLVSKKINERINIIIELNDRLIAATQSPPVFPSVPTESPDETPLTSESSEQSPDPTTDEI